MKKNFLSHALETFMASTIYSPEKIEETEIQKESNRIHNNFIDNCQKNYLESEEKIVNHNKSIADFKEKLAKNKRKNKTKI